MLIAFLIFASAVAVVFLLIGIAIGNTGREQLRQEIANLRERLAAADSRYAESRRIAGELLEVVKKGVGLTVPERREAREEYRVEFLGVARSQPDYVAPQAKNCPQCSVSVRSDSWPQECPACHCMFGFVE